MAEAPGAHISHPREWVIDIKRELEPYIKTTTSRKQKRPILRVGSRLRELRREQFAPQHLFLGLYKGSGFDHNNPKKRGNILKLGVVGAFLGDSRLAINDWENISARIVKDPKAMLQKYNEDGLDDFSTEDVQSVLSLDAIFLAWFCIVFFDSTFRSELRAEFPSVFYVLLGEDRTFLEEIIIDIIKLENQIPLEIIQNALFLFYEILNRKHENQGLGSTSNSRDVGDSQTQADRALQIICSCVARCREDELPGSKFESGSYLNFKDNSEHFLHCVYLNLLRDESDQTKRRTPRNTHAAPCSPTSTSSGTENPLASASQLRKVGINFRGQEGLEVKFERHFLGATLYLPKINYIGDSAEGTWRNFLAFEDQYEEEHPFKSYLFFMDELVDLEEDVMLLRSGKHPVIVNVGIGSNEKVARMFNRMTTYYTDESSEKWVSVRKQILDYYNSRTRQTWEEFKKTNFGKPWLFASFLAACALLVMTLLQTLLAILTYKYTF